MQSKHYVTKVCDEGVEEICDLGKHRDMRREDTKILVEVNVGRTGDGSLRVFGKKP